MSTAPCTPLLKRARSERELPKIVEDEYKLDPDTLECPICAEPLYPPVFQCGNEHHLCFYCCEKVERCPSCAQPIELTSRCLGMEKILDSLKVRCKHAHFGCTEFVNFIERKEHELDFCGHRPFPCPVPDCTSAGPESTFSLHMENAHHVQTVHFDNSNLSKSGRAHFTMKPTDDFLFVKMYSEFFIIHHEVEPSFGDIFFCTSFGGIGGKKFYSLKKNKFSYLKVKVKEEDKSYRMLTTPDVGQREEWKTIFLLVPCAKTMPRAIDHRFDLRFTSHYRIKYDIKYTYIYT